jgi:peptidoglycan/LPS O-acetylase OafA/YrhL
VTQTVAEVGTDRERARRRPARRVALAGGVLSLVGAVVVGLLGASGGGSLVAAFTGGALTVGLSGLVLLVGAVRDEYRGDRVPRRRVVLGVGALLLAPFLLVLAAGAAGTM